MKSIRNNTYFYLAGALMITLSGCSGGGEDSATTTTTTTTSSPYPDPENPSTFPTQADTLEGSGGDNTPSTAGTLTIGSTSYRTNYPLEDEDWVAVTLDGGTQYEFSVDNVSYNGIPKLELYTSSDTATPAAQDWGYFTSGFNPRILYTPPAPGPYYLKVYDQAGGVSSYTLSSRIFSDSDIDTYSPHYDCDDTNVLVGPETVETPGDGVDQSCSGYDWPDSSVADAFELDNTSGTAGSIPIFMGDPGDIINRKEVYAKTHTLHIGDTADWFKITVPAHTYYDIYDIETNGINFDSKLFIAPDTTTPVMSLTMSGFIVYFLDNSASATATDYYLEVKANKATETGVYVIGVGDGGTDVDGDNFFTQSQGSGWDCDDNNFDIKPGATEIASDGTDSNCNGKDDT